MATTQQKLEQGARSREALLDAAIELIADGGYTATGVDSIAKRAGVVKSALYWHFHSKDGLLIAALERTARDWVSEYEEYVVVAADPMQRLDNLLIRVRELFFDRPERLRLIFSALIERGVENPDVRTGVARIFDVMHQTIVRGMTPVLEPIMSHERIEGLAALVWETLAGAFMEYFARPEPEHFEKRLKVVRKMVVLFVEHEIRNRPPQAEAAAGT